MRRGRLYLDGDWRETGRWAAVEDPAGGPPAGEMAEGGAAETRAAIASAHAAFGPWAATPAGERARILRRVAELLVERREEIAATMTAEQGKPLAEARGEVGLTADYFLWNAEEARRIYGQTVPATTGDKRLLVLRQPVGVVAAITPWNFPTAMLGRKLAPALAAGCTAVCKPAPATPLSACAVFACLHDAGLPAGVANLVSGPAEPIGEVLLDDPRVAKLSFTGSVAVGRMLMARAAATLKRVSLELGGHAPFLVFDDADIDAAVHGAMASKYRNTGQTCVCPNRFLIQDGVYEEFARKLKAAVEQLRVGDGLAGPTDQGPLIDANALSKVRQHLSDAVGKGAKIAIGGKSHALGGTFFEPTVLLEVTADMRLAREETFGPVAPLFRFSSEAQAITLANATEFGLASYVYTRDLARSWRVSEALEYGMVALNTGLFSTEVAPFGGIKESGIGREGSKYGILDYTELKYICVGGIEAPARTG